MSQPRPETETEQYLRTVYNAATPSQQALLRELMQQVLVDKTTPDDLAVARLRARFGKPGPQLRAALDELGYRQAVERARAGG